MATAIRPRKLPEPLEKKPVQSMPVAGKETWDHGGSTLSRVDLAKCDRHPDNRHPTAEAVEKIAESIEREGRLLEPIVVRPKPGGRWEIISGETRVLALRKLGRRGEVDAHVLTNCDDARALELLAVYNAARTDLNPIEKARMIERLCQPKSENGGGKTRAEAAAIYKLETHGAASNLVRLLELPDWCQEHIASGKLPQRHGRELLTVMHAAPLMDAVKKMLGKKEVDVGTVDSFQSRLSSIGRATLPRMGHYGGYTVPGRGYQRQEFKPSKEQMEQLQCFEIGKGYDRNEFAGNVELWLELNAAAIEKQREREEKEAEREKARGKAKPGKGGQPAKKPVDRKKQAELFDRNLGMWRHDWLRFLVARDFLTVDNASLTTPAAWRLLLWATVDQGGWESPSYTYRTQMFENRRGELNNALGKTGTKREVLWSALAAVEDREFNHREDTAGVVLGYCSRLLYDGADFYVPGSIVESLAKMLQTDPVEAWKAERAGPLTEQYWELHSKDQLAAIGKEYGLALEGKKKGDMIKALNDEATKKRLPAELAKPAKRKGAT